MKHYTIALLLLSTLVGCTSVNVKPLSVAHNISHIYIEDNPRVTVPGFISVIENKLEDHGISTEVYSGAKPQKYQAILTYTALRSWDLGTYLTDAEIRIKNKEGKQIGYAQYHLIGKGGLDPNKWASVKSKMNPVLDALLKEYE